MNATLCQTPLLCFLISLTYGNGVRMLFDCLVVSLTLRKNFHVHDRSSIRDRWCTYMTGQVYTWLVMYVDWWYTYMTGHVSNGFETHESAKGWWLVMYVHARSCIRRFRDAWGRKGLVTAGHVSNGFETHESAKGRWLVMYVLDRSCIDGFETHEATKGRWLVMYVHDRSCIRRFRDSWGRKGLVTGDVCTWPVMYLMVSRRMRPQTVGDWWCTKHDWWCTYMTGHVSVGFETHEAAKGRWLVMYVHDRSCIRRFRDAWGRKGSMTSNIRIILNSTEPEHNKA